jgi:hypothetical protein
MNKEERIRREGLKRQLADAIANGERVIDWAEANGVAERTAYRWATRREVRTRVEAIRRGFIEGAISLMAEHAGWAVKAIIDLGKSASSESVKLSAARAILCDYTKITALSSLEHRVTHIDEHQRDSQAHNAGRPL